MTPVGLTLMRTGLVAAAAAGLLVGASLLGPRPAAAQGGIVCAYGPASYQRCCSQSYRKNPKLGASARAHDIDACMGKKPGKPKKKG